MNIIRNKIILLCLACVTMIFIKPLYTLFCLALKDETHSYIILVPVITIYMIQLKIASMPEVSITHPWRALALILIVGSLCIVVLNFKTLNLDHIITLSTLIVFYLALIIILLFVFYGSAVVFHLAFPLGFLLFMVPLPEFITNYIEEILMYKSTDLAAYFLNCFKCPVLRVGQIIELPGTSLHVARACSGIRSTLILFISSLVASHIFLASSMHRTIFVSIVIPLGIIRNSFRITVIGLACVYSGPDMIDSWIHHHGGLVFFVVSLIPLFITGYYLRKLERKRHSICVRPENHVLSAE